MEEVEPRLPCTATKYDQHNIFAGMQHNTVPCEKLWDRPASFAILDHKPAARGHSILVVKAPAATLLDDLPPEVAAHILPDLQILVRAVQAATSCSGITVQQNNGSVAGQTVRQLHFHVIPCYSNPDATPSQHHPPTSNAHQQQQQQQSLSDPQGQGSLQLPESTAVCEEAEQGQLLADIRNRLPPSYSGEGCHVWVPSAEKMEQLGMHLQALLQPGTVVLLSGQLGSGKTSIARGCIRAWCRDPHMHVPSPSFLLNLTYQQDRGYEQQNVEQQQQQQQSHHQAQSGSPGPQPAAVHHMDPFRLGTKADKMAGLVDFDTAFQREVCIIEWADRMPKSVMDLPRKETLEVSISGVGAQAAGRHVWIRSASPESPAATALRAWRSQGLPPLSVSWLPGQANPGQSLLFDPSQRIAGPPDSWVVLGIESSCDDTAAAVIRGDGTVLAHKIASQAGLHEQYGGVKPDVARDAHAAAICSTVDGCLQDAGISAADLTAVAVTVGPGLSLCLQVGVKQALTLAATHNKPIVPVHHMEAHALMARMPKINQQPLQFPALLMLVSGGHNMLVRTDGVGKHHILGTTLDDSVGEAFDKVARLLGVVAIPGGPHLEALASREGASTKGAAYKQRITLPLRKDRDSCNYSFSGIKTQAGMVVDAERLRLGLQGPPAGVAAAAAGMGEGAADGQGPEGCDGVQGQGQGAPQTEAEEEFERCKAGIAWIFQDTCVRFLVERAERALQRCKEDAQQLGQPPLTCLVVAGGVAANKAVRQGLTDLAAKFGLPCICPPVKYCTDNGIMVAWTGVERLRLGLHRPPPPLDMVDKTVEVLPRWPLGTIDARGLNKQSEKFLKLVQ